MKEQTGERTDERTRLILAELRRFRKEVGDKNEISVLKDRIDMAENKLMRRFSILLLAETGLILLGFIVIYLKLC